MAVRAYITTDSPTSELRARLALEDAIERALSLLDRMDGDPDLEDDEDEEPDDDDCDGEFRGGAVIGAAGNTVCIDSDDPAAWVRA